MDWLSEKELVGFKRLGKNVLISRHAVIYGRENVEIADNVRIDAFCLIQAATGLLSIGKRVHIAARTTLLCSGKITIMDYAQIATGCSILSASDDFSGDYLIGPMVPEKHRNVEPAEVRIGIGAVVLAHSLILPGTHICAGAVLGSMSLAKYDEYYANTIWAGVPAVQKKIRTKKWLDRVREIEADNHKSLDLNHISDTRTTLPKP